MGQALAEGALCVRAGRAAEARTFGERCLSFTVAQAATLPTGSLKTPGEKPSFRGVELLKILQNSGIRKQRKKDC